MNCSEINRFFCGSLKLEDTEREVHAKGAWLVKFPRGVGEFIKDYHRHASVESKEYSSTPR